MKLSVALARSLYFAQEGDGPQPTTWPEIGAWPAEIRQLMSTALQQ